MQIRPADLKDLKDLERLEKACFCDSWNEKMLEDMLEGSFDEVFVAESEGSILAYGNLRHVCDECEIMRICTDPEHRRGHLGDRLMEKMLNAAKDMDMQRVLLEVRASNMPAICLYKKYGFKEISKRKNYYSSPSEDAVIMEKVF